MLKGLIEAVIGCVLGLALLPVITQAVTDANQSGVLGSLLNIIPILYVIVIVLGVVAYVAYKSK